MNVNVFSDFTKSDKIRWVALGKLLPHGKDEVHDFCSTAQPNVYRRDGSKSTPNPHTAFNG